MAKQKLALMCICKNPEWEIFFGRGELSLVRFTAWRRQIDQFERLRYCGSSSGYVENLEKSEREGVNKRNMNYLP